MPAEITHIQERTGAYVGRILGVLEDQVRERRAASGGAFADDLMDEYRPFGDGLYRAENSRLFVGEDVKKAILLLEAHRVLWSTRTTDILLRSALWRSTLILREGCQFCTGRQSTESTRKCDFSGSIDYLRAYATLPIMPTSGN